MFPMATPTRITESDDVREGVGNGHVGAPFYSSSYQRAAGSSSLASGGPSSSARGPSASPAGNWSLDHFDVGRKLGEGRFGKIYLAREKTTKYAVVLKCISKEAVIHYDLSHQIRREIELHMFCRHRHILRMLAYFWDDERIFLVLDHADGGDLYAQLAGFPNRQVPDRTAAVICAQLCSALKYLHHHKILHRDVKPENLLIKKGVLKLADFTWAVLCHDQNPTTKHPSRRATVCGTLDYMCPEIISNNEYDAAVDCWAVGALTYELLVGTPPFVERSEGETCRRIRAGTFAMPSFVSADAADFVSRLLDVDPARRMTMAQALGHPWLAEARAADHARGRRSESQPMDLDNNPPLGSAAAWQPNAMTARTSALSNNTHAASSSLFPSTSISAVSTSTIVQGSNMSVLNRSSRPQTAVAAADGQQQQAATRLGSNSSHGAGGLQQGVVGHLQQHVSVERALDMTGSDDDADDGGGSNSPKLLSKGSTVEGQQTFPEISSLHDDGDFAAEGDGGAGGGGGGGGGQKVVEGDRRTPTPRSNGGQEEEDEWRNASSLEMTAISVSNNVSAADAF